MNACEPTLSLAREGLGKHHGAVKLIVQENAIHVEPFLALHRERWEGRDHGDYRAMVQGGIRALTFRGSGG
jgi:hypothetical protein